ncbi:MAG TPA: TetR/AcrR family transcriptional regulator [Streptosporangiaceae bacterium]|jgi:AcrR family transcriptional regulator|nr:TetR/AcrR family transcriptional regulator [Streptosporangiaceae bacterium]
MRGVRRGLDDRPTAQRVVAAAAKLFYEKGYSETSMQDVADEVGVLKGSLYYYIKTKEDLLVSVVDDVRSGSLALIDEAAALSGVTAVERLHHYVSSNVTYHARNVCEGAVFHRELRRLSEGRRHKLGMEDAGYEKFVAEMVRAAKREGGVRGDLEVKSFTKYVFAVINSVFAWYHVGGSISPEELGRFYADNLVNGIRPDA